MKLSLPSGRIIAEAQRRDAQIILRGYARIAGAFHQAAGRRRRGFGSGAAGAVGGARRVGRTRLGGKIQVGFRRGSVGQPGRHREQEVIREVFIQLGLHWSWKQHMRNKDTWNDTQIKDQQKRDTHPSWLIRLIRRSGSRD